MGATIRVGIISANWGVMAHLPAWRAVPGVEVVGICTAHQETAEKAAADNNIPRPYWDYHEMAKAADIDVIDVGTRPGLRRDMCLAAFAAGKHVYNGLPFAASLDDAKALRDAHAAAGTVGMVDAYSEQLPPFQLMRELLGTGAIGTVQLVQCRLELSLWTKAFSQFSYTWFADASNGASAPRNLGSHALHLLVYLFGPVAQVAGQIERYVPTWEFVDGGSLDTEVADTAAMTLRFAAGPIGVLTTTWAGAGAPGFVLDVTGTTGRLVLHCPTGMPSAEATIELHRTPAMMQLEVEPVQVPARLLETPDINLDIPWDAGPIRAMAVSFDAMARAIREGAHASPEPGFARAFHVQSIIEAAYRSHDAGTWEKCEGV